MGGSYKADCEDCGKSISAAYRYCPWCQTEQQRVVEGVAGMRDSSDSESDVLDVGDAPCDNWRKCRKKPVEVEFRGPYRSTRAIRTIEGDYEIDADYLAEHGGYVIIRGVEGELYPCALDIFRRAYQQKWHPGAN